MFKVKEDMMSDCKLVFFHGVDIICTKDYLYICLSSANNL